MTRVFDAQGQMVPMTVIEAGPYHVTQVKTAETDVYYAVQLGFGSKSAKRLTKPQLGHLMMSDAEPKAMLREFRQPDMVDVKSGEMLTVEQLKVDDIVHVTGTTKGRGFAGVMKR